MDVYQQDILDHYRYPQHRGVLTNATHMATAENSHCGDKVNFYLLVEGGLIKESMFTGEGCAICLASADKLCALLPGVSTKDLLGWSEQKSEEILGIKLSPSRLTCAHVSLLAAQRALTSLSAEQPQTENKT